MFLPVAYLVVGSFLNNDGPAVPSATTPTCRPASSRTPLPTSIEISLVTAIAGGIFGFLLAVRGHPRRPAAVPAHGADDVLRRRLELRRRPARPGVHLHPRQPRLRDRPPAGRSASSSRGGSSRTKIGPRGRLHVLPVPADDPDHRAGPRRPAAGVARGGRERGRLGVPVLAPRRAADPRRRRSSAR